MAGHARKISPVSLQAPQKESRSGGRTIAIDYLRTFVIVLVLIHHSILAYVNFGHFDPVHYLWSTAPIIDSHRWLWFDLIVLFNDIFFMSLMFFLSGLFVWPSLIRKGAGAFVRDRFLRLGLPFAVVTVFIMPLAYYPSFRMTGANPGFIEFWRQSLASSAWPTGPAWFVWVLLAFDCVIAMAQPAVANLGSILRTRASAVFSSPMACFALVAVVSSLAYLPMLLWFGPVHWFALGPFSVQASRVLLYATYFVAGVMVGAYGLRDSAFGPDGTLAARWLFWVAAGLASFQLIVWMQIHPPAPMVYGLAFALSCATMTFAFVGVFLRLANRRIALLESLNDSAYGIYLIHYLFIVWLQYALLPADLPAFAKGLLVFTGVLALSWGSVVALRRVPAIARII
jgi:surface polysaccharide O-acyltransferase-like enzyme